MSDADDTILHQDDVEAVIEQVVEDMDIVATGDPEAAIVDAVVNASTAHALNSTFSDTEAEAALNALGTKINSVGATVNSILDALQAKGIIDT